MIDLYTSRHWTTKQPRYLDQILRVDHAGEYGAVRIYTGQMAVLGHSDVKDVLTYMLRCEENHLKTFNQILKDRQVRPTVLLPIWHVLGYMLGAGTAYLGKSQAMICTVAVEDVIDSHYAAQYNRLDNTESELKTIIEQFREEEIEHKRIAEKWGDAHNSHHPWLSRCISLTSRAAIWLSKRF
jgi:ubiquinone biosynthesis monooxygenase Coq7